MSQVIDDGGPAFPASLAYSPEGQAHVASEYFANCEGMSLRDWFAGQVLNGIYSSEDSRSMPMDKSKSEREEQFTAWAKADAEWSYRIADAMIAARKEKPV